jgi:hypothetical protein
MTIMIDIATAMPTPIPALVPSLRVETVLLSGGIALVSAGEGAPPVPARVPLSEEVIPPDWFGAVLRPVVSLVSVGAAPPGVVEPSAGGEVGT